MRDGAAVVLEIISSGVWDMVAAEGGGGGRGRCHIRPVGRIYLILEGIYRYHMPVRR